ncbi:hypothetical protein AUJ46_02745 [Candidatus Peregrinibacteria bacterium CG1_02_54_53]|nr:MAG: hypothetical protein AUJ46_02745 [Candidatus Peregrinibacteria bacterium CG1_02_54_53]
MFAHVDADAFFASVLERKDPHLKGKPLLALGAGGGIVIAASYPAKAKGVKTGMRLREAKMLCPEAIALLSDFTEACVASDQIETFLRSLTHAVEQMSVDEWFLDLRELVRGIPTDSVQWARDLQQTIAESVGIGMSVGIAPTKLLAKMASEYRKPAGITCIRDTRYMIRDTPGIIAIETFLRDRPVAAIPGIGRARQVRAASLDWLTAWDFASAEPKTIVHLFGRPGRDLQEELRGNPVSSVVSANAPPKSISRGRSFRQSRDHAEIFSIVVRHLSICILRMREQGLACRHITLWLRDGKFRFEDEHLRLPRPMDTEDVLLPYVRHGFTAIWRRVQGCTQAGLALGDLRPSGPAQYSLFQEPAHLLRSECVQSSLDTIRKRFGRESITRATSLQHTSAKRPQRPNTYGHIGTTG